MNVALLTVTPGMVAARRQLPEPVSKKAEPPDDVPVMVTFTEA
jgi:hypothetical protein